MLSVGLQLSVAEGLSVGSGSEHSMVRSAGQVMTGGVESMIWISWRHKMLVFPQESVPNHIRSMVYCCGHGPAFGMSIYVTSGEGSQASEAVAIPVFEGSVLSLHSMVINGGHISIGAVVSMTVITCTQVSPSLQSLTAIQVRFIV